MGTERRPVARRPGPRFTLLSGVLQALIMTSPLKALFDELYSRARVQRARFCERHAPLRPWFEDHAMKPPILGFGLPRGDARRRLAVTIGINPSAREFEGSRPALPLEDEAERQWMRQSSYFDVTADHEPYRDWFAPAAAFLRAAGLAEGKEESAFSPYSDGCAVHLDLSPLVTVALDTAYDRLRAGPMKEDAKDLVRGGIREILVPLLGALRAGHEIVCVVVFGFVPARRADEIRGNGIMKDTLRGTFETPAPTHLPALEHTVGWGSARAGGPFDTCHGIPFAFVSKGPSYWKQRRVPMPTVEAVGRELRALRERIELQ